MGVIAVRIVAVMLVATACTSEGDRGERSTGFQDESLQGGTLRLGMSDGWVVGGALVAELDPQRSYFQVPWELFRCCLLRTLYSYNGKPTEEGGAELRPDLAAGLPEVSADGLTWTLRLRDGLRYAPPFDDTPIVALDIVRALERTARVTSEEESIGYPFYYSPISGFDEFDAEVADSIAGLQTPDDRTLVIRLDEVTTDLAYRFSLAATAPIPEGAADGHDEDYGRFLVASGPYIVEGSADLDFSVPPEQQQPTAGYVLPITEDGVVQEPGSLALVRNPSWDPATDQLRAALPDRIELTLGGNPVEIADRVDAGELDLSFPGASPAEQVARYRADPELSERLFVHVTSTVQYVSLNLAAPPFDDIHVRRAVSFAIDKAGHVGMRSRREHEEFNAGEVATHIASDPFEGSLLAAFDPYPYDPSRARAEMRSSAYDLDGDGRCDGPACRVTAIVLDGYILPEQSRAIRDALAALGIELVLEEGGLSEFFGLFFDPTARIPIAIGGGWIQDFPAGSGWFSGLFESSGCCNTSLLGASPEQLTEWGYSVTTVPNVDDRVQACFERSGVAANECWAEFDQHLMTDVVPWVPLMFQARAQVVSERVVGYSFDQFTGFPALDRIALAPGSE